MASGHHTDQHRRQTSVSAKSSIGQHGLSYSVCSGQPLFHGHIISHPKNPLLRPASFHRGGNWGQSYPSDGGGRRAPRSV